MEKVDAKLVDHAAGDYRLAEDSPFHGKGITLPLQLNSPYRPGPGKEILSRAWAQTFRADAPDPAAAVPVHGGDEGHYRLQPLPATRALVDLDACEPGTPGLNATWKETGKCPQFRSDAESDVADANAWTGRRA